MTDIFISYAKEDRERVRSLVAVFETHGFSVWWDREIAAGRDFRAVIDQELRSARCVVVVWSTNANASQWVCDEADEGQRRGILVPVLFDNVLPPMGFRGIQAADLTQWTGDSADATIKQLLEDVAPVVRGQTAGRATPDRASESGAETVRQHGKGHEVHVFRRAWWKSRRAQAIAIAAAAAVAVVWTLIRPIFSQRTEPEPRRVVTPSNPKPADSPAPVAPSLPAPVSAEPPPSEYFVLPALGRQADTPVRLRKHEERRNQIIDDDDWWVANRLQRRTYTVPNPFRQETGDLPDIVPPRYQNQIVVKVIRSEPLIAIYGTNFSAGRYLLAIDPANGRALFSFDFSLYEWPPSFVRSEKEYVQMRTDWAEVDRDTLYVAHAHSTSARSSNGFNAYITAIDIPSNRILWRSQPLVTNAGNFVIKDDAIVTGYGFTEEKDYLYVLNKADGRVVQQVLLNSGPSQLIERSGLLYVRTYETDYVFEFTASRVSGLGR
jgi:TIR domain